MDEEAQRRLIVAEAITWIGTHYHDNAHIKGAGVDCAHLLIGVWENVGLLKGVDPGWYSPQWHLHHDEEKYLEWVQKYAIKIEDRDPLPGDIALFKFGRTVSHGAIVIEWPMLIHSYVGRGVEYVEVRDNRFKDKKGRNRLYGIFSFWTSDIIIARDSRLLITGRDKESFASFPCKAN